MARRAISQDYDRAIVVPVVDDVGQDVAVASGRHRREEVAPDHVAPPGQPGRRHALARALGDRGTVEQHALRRRVHLQDGSQQQAAPTTDIDDRDQAAVPAQ